MNDSCNRDFGANGNFAEANSSDLTPPQDAKKATVISLFAGVGGFDLAFERAGAKIVMQCELDRFCQDILKKHWPSVAHVADILTLDPNKMPDADIWTAGFPCQDVSLARGNHGRSGLKGAHTSLFFRLMELVEQKLPRVIILENVVGLLNSHKGSDFAIILRELTERGYAVAWRVLNARYFGIPQSRSRVFLCAWRGDYRRAVETLFEDENGEKPHHERLGFLTPTIHPKTKAIVPEIAYCVAATSGRHTGNDWSRSYVSYDGRVRRPTPTECERLQGFPMNWTVPGPATIETARGFDSERYRAAGNAVAVPVVHWIANRVISNLRSTKRVSRTPFHSAVVKLAPDLAVDSSRVDFMDILKRASRSDFSYRWKSGGCAWGHEVVEGRAPPAPSKIIRSRFVDLLDSNIPDERYFLTSNAAAGIVRRADLVGRTLFSPLHQALVRMAESSSDEVPRKEGDIKCRAQHSSA